VTVPTDKPIDAGAPEIEVTPEMIEAGAEVLGASGAVEYPLLDIDRELIRKIFLAVLSASPASLAKS
jgi:hypothetical protein